MPGSASRDARRTDRYLDGLLEADERGTTVAPMDLDLDPAVVLAARELRAGLVRVHPSFRFEERLAARLARAAGGEPSVGGARSAGAMPAIASFKLPVVLTAPGTAATRDSFVPPGAPRRLSLTARPSRPFVVGGVGVASAAISIGAVYVAWRRSRASQSPMVRAVRAGRSGRAHASGHGRRAAVLHGILGVMS
jgi:hypothetical protein